MPGQIKHVQALSNPFILYESRQQVNGHAGEQRIVDRYRLCLEVMTKCH